MKIKNIIEKIKNKFPKDKEMITIAIFKFLFVLFFLFLLVLIFNSALNINNRFSFDRENNNSSRYISEDYDKNDIYEIEDGWAKDENEVWHFYKDGIKLRSDFLLYDDKEYYLDEYGDMVENSWFEVGSDWYYATTNGEIVKNMWIDDYYLGSDGKMLFNTSTPDGYVVDENGKYIEGIKDTVYKIDNLYSVKEKIDINQVNCDVDIILPMICDEDGVYNHNFNDKLELIKSAVIGIIYQKIVEYSENSKRVYSIICEACSIKSQDYKNIEMEIAGVIYFNENEKSSLNIMIFYNKLTNEINCDVNFN